MITTIVILMLLLMGAIVGFKHGALKQTIMFVGTILVFFIAFLLKNPIANIFFKYVPFIEMEHVITSPALNILFFEALAFFIIASVLFGLLNVIVNFTSIFQKVLNATIILGLPIKLLGIVVGVLQYYIIIFVGLYFLNMPLLNLDFIQQNTLSNTILHKTPILSKTLGKELQATDEIFELNKKYDINSDAYNLKALDIMLKNKIITVNSADILIEKKKIKIPGINSVVEKYRGEQ